MNPPLRLELNHIL